MKNDLTPGRTRFANFKVLATCTLMTIAAACQKAPTPAPAEPQDTAASSAAVTLPPVATTPAGPAMAPAAEPQAGASAEGTVPPGAAAPGAAAPPAPAASPPPPPKPIVIPAGTRLSVRLEAPVGSAVSATGENFAATLENGVTIQGTSVLPRRAAVVGKVVIAKAAGKFAGDATLGLRLESVADRAVVTSTYSRRIEGKGNRTAAVIGGTAVAGALLGALAGHGRGAAIGAVAGGGAGTLGAAETGNNRDIELPPGTVIAFRLRQAISVESHP